MAKAKAKAHPVKRMKGDVVRASAGIGMANTMGAHLPSTVPAVGAGICKAICARLSGWWSFCFCSSVVAWVVGIAAFLIVGEVLRVIA